MSATHLYYTSLFVHLSVWANCLWKSEDNLWGESLIPPCGSQEPNSGSEAWQQTDLPDEPSPRYKLHILTDPPSPHILHNFGFQVNDTNS